MLVSQFEGIKMLEDESFCEFYTKITDLRNSMINLGKKVSDVKLIKEIIKSLPERFRIKVTIIDESKDLDEMKVEELVGSLLTYELSLPSVKKIKSLALKAFKGMSKESSDEDLDEEELAMIARKFRKLLKSKRFKKFSDNFQGKPKYPEQEKGDTDEKDPRGPRCFECSGFGHIWADCRNLKQAEKKALAATLNDDSEKKTLGKDSKLIAFVASHIDPNESYYYESTDDETLVNVYRKLYLKIMELRALNQKNVLDLNLLRTEKSTLV
jgi:RNA-binding protein YhbY